jgi:hypothetical protein
MVVPRGILTEFSNANSHGYSVRAHLFRDNVTYPWGVNWDRIARFGFKDSEVNGRYSLFYISFTEEFPYWTSLLRSHLDSFRRVPHTRTNSVCVCALSRSCDKQVSFDGIVSPIVRWVRFDTSRRWLNAIEGTWYIRELAVSAYKGYIVSWRVEKTTWRKIARLCNAINQMVQYSKSPIYLNAYYRTFGKLPYYYGSVAGGLNAVLPCLNTPVSEHVHWGLILDFTLMSPPVGKAARVHIWA